MDTNLPDEAPIKVVKDNWRFFAELVKTALTVIVLAFVIRVFLIQPFVVEGSSMSPRFHTEDYLIVDKISYRFHEPTRGDIVVFKYPYDTQYNYVKRIIGLPGETVKIDEGKVYIINKENPAGFLLNEPYVIDNTKTNLPTGAAKFEQTVLPNSYFVMGDNRPASSDSREWGQLPKADLIGRVVFQAFPFDKISVVKGASY